MLGGYRKLDRAKCTHPRTMSITSAGIDRTVCEDCGHVSFTDTTELTSEIERQMFARPFERDTELASTDRL